MITKRLIVVSHVGSIADLPSSLGSERFTAFIYDPGTETTDDFRWSVSTWLIAQGCKYMCAWGPHSTLWDDSVDFADIDRPDFDVSDDHCMTAWHDDESLEDGMEFFVNHAIDPRTEEQFGLILDIPGEFTEAQWKKLVQKVDFQSEA